MNPVLCREAPIAESKAKTREKQDSWKTKLLPKLFSHLNLTERKRWQRTMRPELIRNHILPVEPFGGPRNIKRDGDENAGQEMEKEEYHLNEGMFDDLSMAGSGNYLSHP